MAEQVVWVVVGVILAIAVLGFGIYLVTMTQEKMPEPKAPEVNNLYSACRDWLTAGNRYNAVNILDQYKLPEVAEPFGQNQYGKLQFCSETLMEEALTAKIAGQTNVAISGPGVVGCISACSNVKACHDTILNKHPSFTEDQVITCLTNHLLRVQTGDIRPDECGDSNPIAKYSCP